MHNKEQWIHEGTVWGSSAVVAVISSVGQSSWLYDCVWLSSCRDKRGTATTTVLQCSLGGLGGHVYTALLLSLDVVCILSLWRRQGVGSGDNTDNSVYREYAWQPWENRTWLYGGAALFMCRGNGAITVTQVIISQHSRSTSCGHSFPRGEEKL